MRYITHYKSVLGEMLLEADDRGLTGLWFEGQKYYPTDLADAVVRNTLIHEETKRWLDLYFTGKNPDFMPQIHMIGSLFQIEVWNILRRIPFGKTITYGEIAQEIAAARGLRKMSAQAVGGAVGHNRISILIPCHRVLGSGGNLTGYAGGIDRKKILLQLEHQQNESV